MIGACDICDRQNVPVGHFNATAAHPETSACFLCQGETDPDPYGELEENSQMKTYTITQDQMDKLVGAAHSGGMLGGDAAYQGCLTVGAILSEIAFKAGFDKSPGSAPEDDATPPRS